MDEMATWWYGFAPVVGLKELVIPDGDSLEATVARIRADCGWD